MATIMPVYTARAIETSKYPHKRIDMDQCLIQNIQSRMLCIRLDSYYEWNHMMPPSTVVSGVLVRCFFKSNYIIAYGTSFHASKKALVEFLERYPLTQPVKPQFDYAISTSLQGVSV
jgi:hypothetical protein